MNCKYCGSELLSPDADICMKCGKIVEKPSKWWYLVPIFFGIIGGLVMYLALKDEDKKMAKKGLILGIIIGAVGSAFAIIFYAVLIGEIFSNIHSSYPITQPYQYNHPAYFPGVVKFYNVAGGGGVTENRVFKPLPTTLSEDNWVADFDYKFTASNIPSAYPLGFTSNSSDPEQQGPAGSTIVVYHGANSDVLHLRAYLGSTIIDSPGINTGIPIYQNVQYYVRLAKSPTEFTLSVFSDSKRLAQIPGSPVTMATAPTDFRNLNFIQHSGSLRSGPARTLTAEVDNMKISVIDSLGNMQTFFEDGYSSNIGWTQIGSSIAVNGSFESQVSPIPNFTTT
jgi:hypothetical protein